MKTLVIFYSYTGKTRQYANKLAGEENADIVEVKEKRRRSKISAYVSGSFAAMKRKPAVLEEYNCNFSAYDKIIIVMPIWAGHPAPAMNNIIKDLPGGKDIELIFTSGGGRSSSSAEKTKELVQKQGSNVVKYLDVKS